MCIRDSFCSIAVDFEITQVVNGVLGVHAMIDKRILQAEDSSFWNADGSVYYRDDYPTIAQRW